MSRSRAVAYGCLVIAGLIALRRLHAGLHGQFIRLVLYHRHGLGFVDPSCTTGYCDYTMFWLAGTIAHRGQAAVMYGQAGYMALARTLLPYKSGYWPFIYPPTIFLPAAAIARFPLVSGYYGFSLLSTALSAFLLRRAGLAWWCIVLGLTSQMAMWNLYLGQIGLLCGALLALGLVLLPRAPVLAGVLLGLLCMKPQYALLVPVAVLASRNWRAALAGAGTVGILALSTLAIAGPAAWVAYLGPGRVAMRVLMDHAYGTGQEDVGAISVFWMLRSLHWTVAAAYGGQVCAAGGAMATCAWAWSRRGATPLQRVILTIVLTFFVSPYGFNDDLAIYGAVLPALARPGAIWRSACLAWLWLMPAYTLHFAAASGVCLTPLVILAASVMAWPEGAASARRARSPRAPYAPETLPTG